jgi:hypothetical protein
MGAPKPIKSGTFKEQYERECQAGVNNSATPRKQRRRQHWLLLQQR